MTAAIALSSASCSRSEAFRSGLEVFLENDLPRLRGTRVAILTNQTGVLRDLSGITEVIAAAPQIELVAIFGPEHGVHGRAQAGEGVADEVDPLTGVPVYSLYGAQRRPHAAMLSGLDFVLYDIQDVGVRAYTYLATLEEVLRACAENGVRLWVLDRPLPSGGATEGPVLEPELESFVGAHTVPLRHGLTPAEYARLLASEEGLSDALRVSPMRGYRRTFRYEDTGLPWVAPSPNIPTVDAARIYAGTVLIEGTNLSEGRGTTRPFHLIGAPWLRERALAARLNEERLPGCRARPAAFTPTFSKYRGETCGAVELHITDEASFRPVAVAVAVLAAARELHPDEFRFDADRFDRLAGTRRLREAIERGDPWRGIVASWTADVTTFLERAAPFRLYEP